MHRTVTFVLALLLLSPALAQEAVCLVCSAKQARIHLEPCDFSTEYRGQTYSFCEKACLDSFSSDPETWLARFEAVQAQNTTESQLPPFEFALKPAGHISHSDLAGKVLLLNMWATWCGPCKEEMPDLVRLQNELSERGLVVLAISFDKSEQAHRQGVEDLDLNFPSFWAQDEAVAKFLGQLGSVEALPLTLIVDQKGNIVERIEGKGDYPRFRELVEPLLPPSESRAEGSDAGSVAPS